MKIGFFSASLANLGFQELVKWANHSGFASVEVETYENSKHIDVSNFTSDKAREIRALTSQYKIQISALSYAENFLDADLTRRQIYAEHLKKVIIAARDLDVPKILTFIGRDAQRDIQENLEI